MFPGESLSRLRQPENGLYSLFRKTAASNAIMAEMPNLSAVDFVALKLFSKKCSHQLVKSHWLTNGNADDKSHL